MNLKTFLTLFTLLFLVSCACHQGRDISLPDEFYTPERKEHQTEAPSRFR
jgi:hypothetical protein